MTSEPPITPETFEDLSRALHLLHARTIPSRLNADGLVHLEEALGALPTPEEAVAWRVPLVERLMELRAEGLEPSEPPQFPAKAKKLKEAIDLLRKSTEPEGIPSRHARVRLYQMLGNVFPCAETATIWAESLEAHLSEMQAPRAASLGSRSNLKKSKQRSGKAPEREPASSERTLVTVVRRRGGAGKLRGT
jgi:hypothetical protein